jgi:hypothetical protein
VEVLRRYPSAPPGGRRVGNLMRILDALLRQPPTDNRPAAGARPRDSV